MLFTPDFKLGLWNAWIFIVPALVLTLLCILLMTKKWAPSGEVRHTRVSKITLLVASLEIYFFSSRDILCIPATKIRDDMVLRRSSNYTNRISWNHNRFRGLG